MEMASEFIIILYISKNVPSHLVLLPGLAAQLLVYCLKNNTILADHAPEIKIAGITESVSQTVKINRFTALLSNSCRNYIQKSGLNTYLRGISVRGAFT